MKKNLSILKELSKSQQKNTLAIISDFAGELAKEELVNKLERDDQIAITQSIVCMSYVSEPLLEIVQKSSKYQRIYKLLIKSKEEDKLDAELIAIYKERKALAKQWLQTQKNKFIKIILGEQFSNYQKIMKSKSKGAEKIFNKKLNIANGTIQENYDRICNELQLFDSNPLYIILNQNTLKLNFKDSDIFSYVAFLILLPKHQIDSFMYLDNKWEKFPIKWYLSHLPVPEGKALFFYYKQGMDITEIFIQKYKAHDFTTINDLLKSPYLHIFKSHSDIILEAIECYQQEKYSATICTLLPMIEGMIWDFSLQVHLRPIQTIYVNDKCNSIITKNGKKVEDPTIGLFLKQTCLKDIFDKYFIEYFCNELYNERNPILHGRDSSLFTITNAAKKIATIEYLLETMNKYFKDFVKNSLKMSISEASKIKLIDSSKKKKI